MNLDGVLSSKPPCSKATSNNILAYSSVSVSAPDLTLSNNSLTNGW